MAFFCPIFGNRLNKAVEYEDSDYFSIDAPRGLYPSRSLSALHADNEISNQRNGVDCALSKDDILKPNTKIFVTNDFEPTVDDEIGVKKGEIVVAMYKDQDWVYVVKNSDVGVKEGFIPRMYCSVTNICDKKAVHGSKPDINGSSKGSNRFRFGSARSRSLGRKSKVQQKPIECNQSKFSNRPTSPKALENINRFLQSLNDSSSDGVHHNYDSELEVDRRKNDITVRKSVGFALPGKHCSTERIILNDHFSNVIEQKSTVFVKKPQGHYVALYRFEVCVEDDVGVEPGDMLVVLNKDDPDWYWVRVPNGSEGFVPSNYIVPFETDRMSLQSGSNGHEQQPYSSQTENSNGLSRGCELLVVEDVIPEAVDDLQLQKGDWIYSCQSLDSLPSSDTGAGGGGWFWGFCPRTQKYGFVKRSATQLPTATVL